MELAHELIDNSSSSAEQEIFQLEVLASLVYRCFSNQNMADESLEGLNWTPNQYRILADKVNTLFESANAA